MPKKKEVEVVVEKVADGERPPEVEKVKRPPKDVEDAMRQFFPGLLEAAQQVNITFQTTVPFLGQLIVNVPSLRAEAVENGVWAATIAGEVLRRIGPMVEKAREQDEERRRQDAGRARKEMDEWEARQKLMGRAFNPVPEAGYRGPVEKTDCAENESRKT